MQPYIVCLQEHNQHSMAGHHGFLCGYDIYYAGTATYSGVCILVRHELEPHLAFNDSSGRWIVIQCNVNGDILEFASVCAPRPLPWGLHCGILYVDIHGDPMHSSVGILLIPLCLEITPLHDLICYHWKGRNGMTCCFLCKLKTYGYFSKGQSLDIPFIIMHLPHIGQSPSAFFLHVFHHGIGFGCLHICPKRKICRC